MLYLILMFLTRQCLAASNLSALEGRIVKGYKVGIEQFPHSVFLHFQTYIPTACGSTLITDQAVITAAHCLSEVKYYDGKITAFLGATIPLHSAVKRIIMLFAIHPRFQAQTGKYNLGIGFFNKPVSLTNAVKKIPIIPKPPQLNEAFFTTGWGKQNPFKLPDYSDMRHLKASKQRIISEQECQKLTGSRMTPARWCTVSVNGYHYQGDTGNGLVSNRNNLVGVVSYMVNDITIYSDVIREQLWINDTIINLLDNFCKGEKYFKRNLTISKYIG